MKMQPKHLDHKDTRVLNSADAQKGWNDCDALLIEYLEAVNSLAMKGVLYHPSVAVNTITCQHELVASSLRLTPQKPTDESQPCQHSQSQEPGEGQQHEPPHHPTFPHAEQGPECLGSELPGALT